MSNMYVPDARNYRLTGSVGAGGRNAPEDVRVVQQVLANCGLYKGRIDTHCGIKTEAAIREYQNFMQKPDGRVDVDGRTWQYMTGRFRRPSTPAPRPQLNPAPAAGGIVSDAPSGDGPFFPFAVRAKENWTAGGRQFGAGRRGTVGGPYVRAHAGCDLYQELGTSVHAVKAGRVTRVGRNFAGSTSVVEISHGDFTARYAEVKNVLVHEGQQVSAGQKIAEVDQVNSNHPMLHFEMYSTASAASLTENPGTIRAPQGLPAAGLLFKRRSDLMDPTPYLTNWSNSLAPRS